MFFKKKPTEHEKCIQDTLEDILEIGQDQLEVLEEHLQVAKDIRAVVESLNRHLRGIRGVKLVFGNVKPEKIIIKKGDVFIMPDVTMSNGQKVPVELHYVDTNGNDLGPVPATDSPSFATDDPASLGLAQQTDGTVVVTDTHSGDTDITANLTGSAKGFSATGSVLCKGVAGPPPPPPPTPAGVKLVFGTPA